MSRKLLMNNTENTLVKNNYSFQYYGYPIIVNNDCLDTETESYIDELCGDITNSSETIEIIGDLQADNTYKIDIISCDNQFCFGRSGKIE